MSLDALIGQVFIAIWITSKNFTTLLHWLNTFLVNWHPTSPCASSFFPVLAWNYCLLKTVVAPFFSNKWQKNVTVQPKLTPLIKLRVAMRIYQLEFQRSGTRTLTVNWPSQTLFSECKKINRNPSAMVVQKTFLLEQQLLYLKPLAFSGSVHSEVYLQQFITAATFSGWSSWQLEW